MRMDLNGAWEFREAEKGEWKSATVPGCNYLDLLALKEIPDPFIGTNEKDVYWVAQTDWEYKKRFTVDKALLSCDCVRLECKTLDTICTLYLNENCIGSGENAHFAYSFDVKENLREGENELRIVFASPVNFVKEKQAKERCPRNANGQDGIPHIRKPQCHFGWDWGPVLPPSGISGDIAIVGYNAAQLQDVLVLQTHKDGKVTLKITAEAEIFGETAVAYEVSVHTPDGVEICGIARKLPDNGKIEETVLVENPELWWTRDLSDRDEQPLYTVTVTLLSGDSVCDSLTQKIGLRTITLNRERDQYGENFQFFINGVPLFIKGANWIPPDSFATRYTQERLEYDLQAVKFSNMNMLRIWGGGYYESDALYSACDRYGILLWQDFCFACQPYPFFDPELLANVQKEVEYNVKRLRHHASLAIWNGNNEIETMSIAWRNRLKYVEWTEKFFYHILPEWMQSLDTQTPYIPGSPCGVAHMKGFDRDNVGDTHLWAVWHGLQPLTYYRKRMTRFCSEFGFESLPDKKTIEIYAEPKDYALDSEVFTAHQKCSSGNMKMAFYIASRFRLPKHFEDYIYLSQICQEECVRDATEHWRRNKGRCNGSMYWQLNDCWPVCSWASMDYYGNYKALQYCARHFNAPVTVSVKDSKEEIRVFALNDKNNSVKCEVRYRLLSFNGETAAQESKSVSLEALQNQVVFALPVAELRKKADLKNCIFVTELLVNDKVVSRRTVLFDMEKNLKLPKTQVEVNVTVENGVAHIQLTAKQFTRFLQVYSATNTKPFSDNYFDLLPGETAEITQEVPKDATAESVKKDISLFSLGDVEPAASKTSDFFVQAKVFLQPINFGSYIYNRKIPGDYPLK